MEANRRREIPIYGQSRVKSTCNFTSCTWLPDEKSLLTRSSGADLQGVPNYNTQRTKSGCFHGEIYFGIRRRV